MMTAPNEILNQLEDYQAWRRGVADYDLIDYLMCVGTADSIIAMFDLVYPDLVEVDGNLFLKHRFTEDVYRQWVDRLATTHEIQRVMNHLHVSSFVQGKEVSNEVAAHIAATLARIWSALFAPLGLVAEAYGDDLETAQVTLFGVDNSKQNGELKGT